MLETCDKLINVSQVTIRVKRRLKDGLAEGLLTGAIRLPGFRSNWGSLKLGEVCTRINRKNSELNQNALTISAQDGLVAQGEYFSKRIAAIDLSGYLLLHNGEFAYNKSYSKGYPMGAIKRLNAYKKGAVSTLYLAFTPTRIESDYLQHYFEQGLFNKVLSTVTQEGARNHGLLNISAVDFFDADVYVPLEPEEQIAIAQILTAVDDEITTLERKLAIIKTQRKYLLNNLVTGKIRVPETLKPLAKEPTHA
ncbi:restriction endonuclease subunit S [bacterium]|nr:MAG: restriction endonuclease subunit S [bacterium]